MSDQTDSSLSGVCFDLNPLSTSTPVVCTCAFISGEQIFSSVSENYQEQVLFLFFFLLHLNVKPVMGVTFELYKKQIGVKSTFTLFKCWSQSCICTFL